MPYDIKPIIPTQHQTFLKSTISQYSITSNVSNVEKVNTNSESDEEEYVLEKKTTND